MLGHLSKDKERSKEHLNPDTTCLILKLAGNLIVPNEQSNKQLSINSKEHPNGTKDNPSKLFPRNLNAMNFIIHNENKQRSRTTQCLYDRLC